MHIRPGRRESPHADPERRAAALERDEIEMLLGKRGAAEIADTRQSPPPRTSPPERIDREPPAADRPAADRRPHSGDAPGDAPVTPVEPRPFEWPQLAAGAAADATGRGVVDAGEALDVRIVLGEAELQREAADRLAEGAVVALDAAIGAPVDVLVGHRRVARGEVVVMGETFGVRIAELFDEIEG